MQPELPQKEEPAVLKTASPIAAKKVSSKFSITAVLQKSEEKEEVAETTQKENLPSNHFTETDLRTAQINYYTAIYQLLSSKIDVQKALGQINY